MMGTEQPETALELDEASVLTPAAGYYLVRMDKRSEVTAAGLHLPNRTNAPATSKYLSRGTVVRGGLGRFHPMKAERMKPQYNAGEKVMFPTWVNLESMSVKLGDRLHVIADEKDIVARIA